jgi:hypothetical protein
VLKNSLITVEAEFGGHIIGPRTGDDTEDEDRDTRSQFHIIHSCVGPAQTTARL